MPMNICSYNNVDCATVLFSLSSPSSSLSFRCQLLGFLCVWARPPFSHSQLAVVWLQGSSPAGHTRGQLHSEIANTVQYGHGSCWVRKTSRRMESWDRGREARRIWETWKDVREQESKAELVKNAAMSFLFFFLRHCFALTTCMKLGCHKMLNMVIISCTHTLTHIWTLRKGRHI